MRYWISVTAVGVIIGALTIIMPGGLLQREDERDFSNLEQLSNKELLKKIDAKRIEAVRLSSSKRYLEAIDIFLNLVDINHYDQFNYSQLARIAGEVGMDRFEELLSTAESKRAIYDMERIRGAVYYQTNDLQEAERHIDAFLAQATDDLAATFYKGAILRKTNRFPEARKLLTSVIEREKTYFFAYLELQELYETIGETAQAQKMLELAFKYNPANNENAICHGAPQLTGDG